MTTNGLRKYHAAVWDEPLVMEMGAPGRRGQLFPVDEPDLDAVVGDTSDLIPESLRRGRPADLPELSEPEVLRHYLHLSQEVLGMMGISLFGTCTMKYNPRVTEALTRQPFVAETHPDQDVETLQGTLGSSTGSIGCSGNSPGWTSSCSSRAGVPTQPSSTPR